MKTAIKVAALAAVGALALALAGSAGAAQIFSTGYSTPNGDGRASGGTYNYWDLGYSGAGATTVDGAALTGGSGDLTDGVVASDFWFNVENGAGTGPYVGWYLPATADPLLTFHFAPSQLITSIGIHFDNSHQGSVVAPHQILVDGVSQAYTAPAAGTIGWSYLTGLNLTGNSHTVQFKQGSGWTFVSEITFDGGRGVPEPATWGLMILGFGAAGSMLRRRRLAA